MDTSGARFVPIVDLTDDDGDTISHMSEIPLQLPTSANASSNNSALVTFAQAGERSRATRSLSPTDTKSDQCESFALMYPATYPQCVLAVLGPQEVVQLVTQRAQEALHDQRENGSTCSAPSTRKTSCCHSSICSGCEGKTLSRFWQEIKEAQLLQRADARSATRENCNRDFLRTQIKLLKIINKFW